MPGRRQFLMQLTGSAAALSLWGLAPPRARAADPRVSLTRLTDRLTLVSGAGGNVVALSSPDGLLLVDCGTADRSRDLVKALASLEGGHRIRTVFNTHWHWDHTGGNELLRKSGAQIIAHENTRLWLGTEVWVEWENRTYKRRPPEALPTQTFYTTGTLDFGGEPIEYGYLGQAHTDGDLYVYFRNQNVLVAGDVVSVGAYPVLDYSTGGWIGGMAGATQKLIELANDKTQIVPGSGVVQTRAQVAAEHDMLVALQEDLWQLMRKGLGPDDMIQAQATHKYDSQWGNPDLFVKNTYRGLYGHVREMRGVV
jgi:glyoxylase-like metal-dependent hydrolase (beta-lactamase superfamily II)